jgi:hypothetical protein
MRRALFAGLFLVVWPVTATAQNAPYFATVSDLEVLVRAGPSDKFPETGALKRGTRVAVDHEESGWLAITAPHGSVSWVPIAFVDFDPSKPVPQNVMVSEDVTLAAGKVGLAQPLTEIRKAKAPAGSSLMVIGQRVTFDNKQWYPVEPLFGDFRYVHKSAVQAGEPASTAFVVREAAPAGLAPAAALISRPTITDGVPKPPIVNHPLWLQAEAAERDNRPDDAEKLYFQLARLMNEPGGDHDVANLCYTRIHALREKKRASKAVYAPSPSGSTSVKTDSPKPDRPTLLPPVRTDQPVSTRTQPSPVGAADRSGWTGAGKLVSTPLALDGRQTYALESAPGIAQLYVVAGAGVDLKPFQNRNVKVNGLTHTHPNAKKPYIVATDVVEAN